ncbi:MAG: PaREP1 family protein [Sulfolobaceae archaeon]
MSSFQIRSLISDWIKEADELLEKGDIVQASEKYYKAAEEAVKLMVKELNLTEILEKVKKSGRWSSALLFEGARAISPEMYSIWVDAWYLHIYGFHEMRIDYKEVKKISQNIHKILDIIQK